MYNIDIKISCNRQVLLDTIITASKKLPSQVILWLKIEFSSFSPRKLQNLISTEMTLQKQCALPCLRHGAEPVNSYSILPVPQDVCNVTLSL